MRKECHWKGFTSVGLDESNVLLQEVEGKTQARISVNEVRTTWHTMYAGASGRFGLLCADVNAAGIARIHHATKRLCPIL